MTTEVAELLTAARALVLKGWTQGFYARTPAGECVSPESETAAAWCLSGALMAANDGTYDDGMEAEYRAFTLLQEAVAAPIPDWNDEPGRTQAEVVEALEKAIEKAMAS
jgi:hypothetical protein